MTAGLNVDYDPKIWVYLDTGDQQPKAWAALMAAQCWREAGMKPRRRDLKVLAARLLLLQQQTAHLGAFAFWHLPSPDPDLPLGPLALISVYDGDESTDLDDAAGAYDPDVAELPQVSDFPSSLGVGRRCLRLIRLDPGRVDGSTSLVYSYVWVLPSDRSIVRLACSGDDPEAMARLGQDVDNLARAIRCVDM